MSLEDVWLPSVEQPPDLVVLDEALNRLTESVPELGQLVELLFFGGFTQEEVAVALAVSESTVNRRWRVAKAWLLRYLGCAPEGGAPGAEAGAENACVSVSPDNVLKPAPGAPEAAGVQCGEARPFSDCFSSSLSH